MPKKSFERSEIRNNRSNKCEIRKAKSEKEKLKTFNIMKVTRIFHPVGQGAFYTESFEDKQDSKYQPRMVVYDCGSEQDKKLNAYLESYFPEKSSQQVIDAVFISHLHNDHINGLPNLLKLTKVKKIFLPLFTPSKIVEAFLFNKAFYSISESKNANDTILMLLRGGTKYPQLIEIEEFNGDTITNGELYNIDDEQNSIHKIAAGTKITLGLNDKICSQPSNPIWVYIPFNLSLLEPTIHEEYIRKFKNEEEKEKVLSIAIKIIDLYKIYANKGKDEYLQFAQELINIINLKYKDYSSNQSDDFFEEEFNSSKGVDMLKKIYHTLFGKINNSQSMAVFSGIKELKDNWFDIEIKSNLPMYGCNCHCHPYMCHCMHHCLCENKIPCNFLFMGDYEAKAARNFQNLKCFYESYKVWNTFCGLQIPHHGSRANLNQGLYEGRCFAVASAGMNNRFKHPNIDTIINITNQGCCPNVVTEDINTLKYQHFYIQ